MTSLLIRWPGSGTDHFHHLPFPHGTYVVVIHCLAKYPRKVELTLVRSIYLNGKGFLFSLAQVKIGDDPVITDILVGKSRLRKIRVRDIPGPGFTACWKFNLHDRLPGFYLHGCSAIHGIREGYLPGSNSPAELSHGQQAASKQQRQHDDEL